MKKLTVKGYFDKYAREYLSQRREKFKWYRWLISEIIKEASPRSGQKILDLGTGTGFLAIRLSKSVGKNGSIIGLDVSEKMINEARRIINGLKLTNIRFSVKRMEKINFPVKTFDTIVSNLAIDHVKNKNLVLAKIHSYLKTKGKLVIGSCFKLERDYVQIIEKMRKRNPNKAKEFDHDWKLFIKAKISKGYYAEHPIEYEIGQFQLKGLMEKAGFANINITKSHIPEFAVISGIKSYRNSAIFS